MLRRGWALAAAALWLTAAPVLAQTANDVPREHWAYEAVSQLASDGLIKGYPPDGNFFGKRTVSRYEMATLVQRVLSKFDELLAGKANKGDVGVTPPPGVTPEQLAAVRKLVEDFKIELGVIGTDLQKVKDQIGELKQDVGAARAAAEAAAADAATAKKTAEGVGNDVPDMKEGMAAMRAEMDALAKNFNSHKLSGYLQLRAEAYDSGKTSLFKDVSGTGGPAVGGPWYGFLARRARLKFGGQFTTRTDYALQLDVPSVGAVAIKDAYINVADLPFPARGTATLGLFAPPFGVELPASSSTRESAERALGFSDSSASTAIHKGVAPMFNGQDRDTGAMLSYALPNYANPKTRIQLAVFNGEGRGASGVRNTNTQLDSVARVSTTLMNDALDLGVSAYYGAVGVKGVSADSGPTKNAYRMLVGADMRYFLPWGDTLRAEYAGGVYELTPDRSLYLKGNHAHAWLVSLRHPFNRRLELALKYDEFYPVSQTGVSVGGLGRMQLMRKTLGAGLLYNLDEATRLRLWYSRGLTPYDPSATSGPARSRLGLVTGEIQITY